MGKVQAQAIMSLDGYIAKQDNTIGRLFDWLRNGEVALQTPAGDFEVHLSPPSAAYWQQWYSSLGVLVCGRNLFDVAGGWQGRHTLDVPVVVVTHHVPTDWVLAHPDAPFTFVTEGVETAIARAQGIAGDRIVSVTGGTIARQCLELGLLDEVAVDLVPVVMGEGNRPFSASSPPTTWSSATRRSAFRGIGSLTSSFPSSDNTFFGVGLQSKRVAPAARTRAPVVAKSSTKESRCICIGTAPAGHTGRRKLSTCCNAMSAWGPVAVAQREFPLSTPPVTTA